MKIDAIDPLALYDDRQLLEALRKRGRGCVIGFVKQDETTGTDGGLFSFTEAGDAATCLGLASIVMERIRQLALRGGMDPEVVSDIVNAGTVEAERFIP